MKKKKKTTEKDEDPGENEVVHHFPAPSCMLLKFASVFLDDFRPSVLSVEIGTLGS